MRRRVTLNLEEQLLESIRRVALDEGVPEEQVLEEALRRYFGLRGLALLADLEQRQAGREQLSDEEAMALAVSELRAMRAQRRQARGA
ncbi:MAG: hypothetical protein ACRDY7_03290 [Acidimicrobiia bacterium]